MDALIMAAGRGSRLGAHTDDRPKALVDLGGISPLELQHDLLADRGIERVILVTGYRRADVERAAIARTDGTSTPTRSSTPRSSTTCWPPSTTRSCRWTSASANPNR